MKEGAVKGKRKIGRYRKITTAIWNDEKIRKLSHGAQLVFLRLLTHQSLTGLGAMRTTRVLLAIDFDFRQKEFDRYFDELLSQGLIKIDEEAKLLVLPNFIKHNSPESPNVIKSWPKGRDELPECSLLREVLWRACEEATAKGEGFKKAFQESFPELFEKTLSNQEQKQAINQEQTQEFIKHEYKREFWNF